MFEKLFYLLLLLMAIGCLGLLDRRFKLAYFYDRKRTVMTLMGAVLVFIAWDVLGIHLEIFRIGTSPYISGVQLGREFPLEEVFFLVLLTYNALLLWRAGDRLWPRT